LDQRLRETTRSDGTRIAFATAGRGPALLLVDGWLSHLEVGWAFPPQRYLLECLAQGRMLVRYDRPGSGLSDRPPPGSVAAEVSLGSELETLAAVVAAAGLDRFELLGTSMGTATVVAWAAQYPQTVDRLVLYGGFADGSGISPPEVQEHVAGLVGSHWGLGTDVLADIFAPEAAAATRAAFVDYMRQASSAETAVSMLRLSYAIDVTDLLASVRAPTLVMHRQHDRAAPLEQSRLLAAGIANATLQVLPGRSHLPYIGDVDSLVAAVRQFLGLPTRQLPRTPVLTRRQSQVAALVSEGLTNREIGERLGIGERSAEGHVERIRTRLGVRSRAQIAAWWVASRT
jgi:pimeloyl-ACP methyl ester carboxylesterase/DNA-binding CsgD family transcriptional regulator